jgi:ABC-type transporter Mla MlaB component
VNEEYERLQSQQQQNLLGSAESPAAPLPMMDFKRQTSVLSSRQAQDHQLPAFIVVDCSGFNYVDITGMDKLCDVFEEMQQIRIEVGSPNLVVRATTLQIQVLFAAFKGNVRDALKTGGFYEQVPAQSLFPTVHDAVTFAHSKIGVTTSNQTLKIAVITEHVRLIICS